MEDNTKKLSFEIWDKVQRGMLISGLLIAILGEVTKSLELNNLYVILIFSTLLILQHLCLIIDISNWLYEHLLIPFGEVIISLYHFIIKLILHPIVSDYEAREYNYQQIIKKQQKELASIDPEKYTWNDLKETDDELVYRESEKFFNNRLYEEEK